MLFKTISFIFPRPLELQEVDMLTEAGQAIAEGAKKRMLDTANKLKIISFANKAAGVHADRFIMAASNFSHFFRLTHPTPTTYVVMMEGSLFNFMDIEVGGRKLASYQDQILHRTARFILNRPIKDMGFSKEEVRIERGEMEAE